jgi:hypothetical protein
MNASSQIARSFDASLDIGPDAKVISQDKLEDLLAERSRRWWRIWFGWDLVASISSGGFLSVTAGSIDSQTINNTTAGIELGNRTTAACWVEPPNGSAHAESDGTLMLDTIGSTADTVLAVSRHQLLLPAHGAGHVTQQWGLMASAVCKLHRQRATDYPWSWMTSTAIKMSSG